MVTALESLAPLCHGEGAYFQQLRMEYQAELDEYESQMDDGNDNEDLSVRYYKARFIGGPLDGLEEQIGCHEGINDGFWTRRHGSATTLYDYTRIASGHFEDSDYVLIRSMAKSATELKADQQIFTNSSSCAGPYSARDLLFSLATLFLRL